jgi:zinc transport system substrate-binding protein
MNSDIFIYVGGSERWIERIFQSMNTDEMTIFAMMNVVELVKEEFIEGMEHHDCDDECDHDHHHAYDHHDHHHHDHHDYDDECDHDTEYDEHVWTSPGNAILIVRYITELLCKTDPANCAFYRENAAAYIKELEQLDAAFTEVVAGAKRRTIVFGDRFPFRYFTKTYGLTYYAAFPGCSTETEPSAATVAFLINKIRAEQIPVVFHIELSNERMINTISSETGAKKLLLHSVHNITRRDFDAGLGYLDFKRRNVDNLREALH